MVTVHFITYLVVVLIVLIVSGPTPAEGYSYASYLPGGIQLSRGEIKACSINYCHRTLAQQHDVYVANYTTGASKLIVTLPTGSANGGSIQMVFDTPIDISGGQYIGICVKDPNSTTGTTAPSITIEGTVHLTIDLS